MDVHIAHAAAKGMGVFASREFKKGESVIRIRGEIVETENPSAMSEFFKSHCFPLGRKGKKYVYVSPTAPWMYVNHTCEPNTGIRNDSELVAIRDIGEGEEICFDYATNNIDGWSMECRCGSKSCRGVISTFDKLDKNSQERLRGYLLGAVEELFG